MKLPAILEDLTQIAGQFGYVIRKEKGGFRSGNCVLNSQKIIVVNVLAPYESRVSIIARVLAELPLESVFLKPAVREYIVREKKIKNSNTFHLFETDNLM
ncbi:MAG: hypothetical protein HYZ54_10095 [Ignavibacteriae bacterium]|nr:hypothetical protein [Ignavibacteriota bacterium]